MPEPSDKPALAPKPVGVKAPHGSPWFEISWDDGVTHKLSNAVLRGYCPCAGCQGHSATIQYVSGRDTDLTDIEQVGNYALKLVWSDGHNTGLYSFPYLHKLGGLYAEFGDELPSVHPIVPRLKGG